MSKVRIAILGATGFSGQKLTELLLSHPQVEISYLSSRIEKETPYAEIFPRLKNKTHLFCEPFSLKKAIERADIFFLALPHTVSMKIAPELLKAKKRVIDLSADYRLKNPSLYKKYYNFKHCDLENLKKSVYGLPEIFRRDIARARLVANPGCYATAVILSLYPSLAENIVEGEIVIDAKSSISGAGKTPTSKNHYCNVVDNIWVYKPFFHQHLPEITQVLFTLTQKKPQVIFTPQVVGVKEGIYLTVFFTLKKNLKKARLFKIYEKYYQNSFFVRIRQDTVSLKDVVGTNFCDISLFQEGRKVIIATAIDNLLKGAAGEAVQNMNIMLGFDEKLSLC